MFKNKMLSSFYTKIFATISCQYIVKNYGGRSSLKTQLKIEFLLPYTGSRKVLGNIPAV